MSVSHVSSKRELSDAEKDRMLELHNQVRAQYGMADLTWSSDLAVGAQEWANHLAAIGALKHSEPDGRYGENLFWGGGNYTPADVVGLWRSEEKDYHGEQIDSSNYKVFGHFTQMIWKDTKELGGGKAAGTSGVYWVCRYRSAGNIIGQKPYSGNFWTELVIRDAEDDQGKIPYQGKNWWQSPDITVNPGPDTDKAIHLGEPNQIVVCVWNKGTSDLPVGVRYTVSLGWDRPAATVPYPLPKDQVIGQVEEVLGSNWKKDTPRKTSFTWRPLASKIPFGHHCLVAWVNALQDPVLDTPAVNYDDNRAQRNIEFCKAPSPGEDGYGRFWLNPQPKISDRSLEITFRYGSDAQLLRRVRLHLPCSVEFNEITGGELVERSEADDWVIGNIDPAGQVRFDGIGVSQPELLTIEVWAQPEGPAKRAQSVDVDVVEYGRLEEGAEIIPMGGLTQRFEEGGAESGLRVSFFGVQWLSEPHPANPVFAKALLYGVPWDYILNTTFPEAYVPMAAQIAAFDGKSGGWHLLIADVRRVRFDPSKAMETLWQVASTKLEVVAPPVWDGVAAEIAKSLNSLGIDARTTITIRPDSFEYCLVGLATGEAQDDMICLGGR